MGMWDLILEGEACLLQPCCAPGEGAGEHHDLGG